MLELLNRWASLKSLCTCLLLSKPTPVPPSTLLLVVDTHFLSLLNTQRFTCLCFAFLSTLHSLFFAFLHQLVIHIISRPSSAAVLLVTVSHQKTLICSFTALLTQFSTVQSHTMSAKYLLPVLAAVGNVAGEHYIVRLSQDMDDN